MATIAITPDQDAVALEIHIAAPPERVFQAITDPRQLLQWWGQKGMYRCTQWSTDVRPGGQWRSEGVSDQDGSPFHVGGEYLEVDPPRRLAYTWNASWCSHLKTVVQWDLESTSGGTLARVRHSGFAGDAAQATGHRQGWERVISWMQAFVEQGITVADRPAPKQ
ncbi:MAG: SRPBCC domain-containing protein [Terriglobales bacterium]